MSFWKSLFGGGQGVASDPAKAKVVEQVEYKGFTIAAQPYAEGGQFQVAGSISKDIDGVRKEHRFVRADRFGTIEEAAAMMVTKAKQMIDQQGVKIFG